MQFSPLIASIICIVLALGSAVYLLRTLIRQHASKRWPTTPGEILESHLEEDSDGWCPNVRYVYVVNRKRHLTGRLYFFLSNSSTEREAGKHISPYPVGKSVTVYYNPRKPEDAVLDRRMPLWWPLFWLFFSLFMLVVGVAMWHDGSI